MRCALCDNETVAESIYCGYHDEAAEAKGWGQPPQGPRCCECGAPQGAYVMRKESYPKSWIGVHPGRVRWIPEGYLAPAKVCLLTSGLCRSCAFHLRWVRWNGSPDTTGGLGHVPCPVLRQLPNPTSSEV